MNEPILQLRGVTKRFTLHHQGSLVLPVLDNVHFDVYPGECLVLDGASGMGKSTLLKLIYANYRVSTGAIHFSPNHQPSMDLTQASPRDLIKVRREQIGYVSQFLRVIPRVSTLSCRTSAFTSWTGQQQARTGPGTSGPLADTLKNSRTTLGTCASNLFRRGTTAREYCSQHDQTTRLVALGRTHRLARCDQHPNCYRIDQRSDGCRYRCGRNLS